MPTSPPSTSPPETSGVSSSPLPPLVPPSAGPSRADGAHPGSTEPGQRRRCRGDDGQATTEYALILLAAALVGLLVVAWATAGGAAGRIGQLFDAVVDAVMSRL